MHRLEPPSQQPPTPCQMMAPARLFRPPPALAGVLRAVVVRDTRGWPLPPEQRFNRYPALPTCCITWTLAGQSLTSTADGSPASVLAPVTVSAPQTRPAQTTNPGPVHSLMAMFYPDAFQRMSGVQVVDHVDRACPAQGLLSAPWLDWCRAVVEEGDDVARVARIEEFIAEQWAGAEALAATTTGLGKHWIDELHQRAQTGHGDRQRSPRQISRLIKQWTGQSLRELRGWGRAEHAFFEAIRGREDGTLRRNAVALDSGYADQAHLCRDTLRLTGCSPDALRRGMLGDESFWIYRLWSGAA